MAGAIGAAVALLWSVPSFFLFRFERTFWVNSLFSLVLGHSLKSIPDWVVGYFLYFLWASWIGSLFGLFVMPKPGQGDYYLRALGLSWVGWLITYSLGTFFRVHMLLAKAWQTAASNIVTLVIYGFVLGGLMQHWDNVYEGQGAVQEGMGSGQKGEGTGQGGDKTEESGEGDADAGQRPEEDGEDAGVAGRQTGEDGEHDEGGGNNEDGENDEAAGVSEEETGERVEDTGGNGEGVRKRVAEPRKKKVRAEKAD